jgi:hypothetical protein
VAALAACGGSGPAAPLRAAPSSYLLGIDQLISPDFGFDSAPHSLTAAGMAATDPASAALLTPAGFAGAATEDFFRDAPDLPLLNGPVQIGDTVVEFDSAGGAAMVFRADITHLDSVRGSSAVSTGALGDAAHATTRSAVTSTGTTAVEITVEWRVDNVLDILVVRGRQGGIRPDDAFLLAHRQTVTELDLSTPAGSATSKSTASG